jgi:hypothetical protein
LQYYKKSSWRNVTSCPMFHSLNQEERVVLPFGRPPFFSFSPRYVCMQQLPQVAVGSGPVVPRARNET